MLASRADDKRRDINGLPADGRQPDLLLGRTKTVRTPRASEDSVVRFCHDRESAMYACHFRPFLTAGLILSIGVESPLSAAERPAAHWHAPSPADGHAQWIENAPLNVMTLARTGWIQFVRIEGLDGMVVEFATASGTVRVVTPAVVGLATGMTYRVRLTNIPSRPQVDLHPTLQLIGFLRRRRMSRPKLIRSGYGLTCETSTMPALGSICEMRCTWKIPSRRSRSRSRPMMCRCWTWHPVRTRSTSRRDWADR